MLELTPDQLATVRRILAAHAPGREVRVFGSRATGRARPHSDLDLLILGAPLDAAVRSDLIAAFEESDLPFRVDIIHWQEAPAAMLARIEREAEPLVCCPANNWH